MIIELLSVFHILIFCWAFYNILYFGIKPSKSISWILVVLLIPFFGALLFLLIGINRRKLKFIELKEIKRRRERNRYHFEEQEYENSSKLTSSKARKISRIVYNNTYKPVYFNNKVEILKSGKKTFDSIYKALENAKEFIHIQYYIIEDGIVFDTMCKIFEKKCKEGVEIRILYDALGSFNLTASRKESLQKIGIEIHPIMPLSWGSFLFTINHRNHRKICIIDNTIAFIGGVNISDIYIKETSDLGIWQDTHLKVEGAIVEGIHRTFLEDYFYATSKDLSHKEKYLKPSKQKGKSTLQIVESGPESIQHVVMQQYTSFINLAEKSVCILNPYFLPTYPVLEALKMAAHSGVNVSLLLPKKTDSKLATYGMYSYFEELLTCGINIYLRDDFSHSKVLFIDDEISSIGSTNFDCRSFEHNYEINAILYDKEATKEIRNEFDERCQKAIKLNLEEFKKRSIKQKTLERFSRFLSPLL